MTSVCTWFAAIPTTIATYLQRPRLSDHLPPVPECESSEMTRGSAVVASANESAEKMFLDIMRAPSEYVDAVILVARATHALRKCGDAVFAEGFVVFTLSRMGPDNDGTISIGRLRERLHDTRMHRDQCMVRAIVPTLLRLEKQGVVALQMETTSDIGGTSRFIQLDDVRIRLLEKP